MFASLDREAPPKEVYTKKEETFSHRMPTSILYNLNLRLEVKKKLSPSLSQKLKCSSSMGGSEDIFSTSTSSHSECSNLIFFGVLVNRVTGLFLTLKGFRNSFCAFVDFFDGVLCFLEENGLEVPTDSDVITKLFLIVKGLFFIFQES